MCGWRRHAYQVHGRAGAFLRYWISVNRRRHLCAGHLLPRPRSCVKAVHGSCWLVLSRRLDLALRGAVPCRVLLRRWRR